MSTLSTYVLTSNIKQMDYTEIISIFYSKNKISLGTNRHHSESLHRVRQAVFLLLLSVLVVIVALQ
jgi:hypothetical protein